jgi:hypothetical protein
MVFTGLLFVYAKLVKAQLSGNLSNAWIIILDIIWPTVNLQYV